LESKLECKYKVNNMENPDNILLIIFGTFGIVISSCFFVRYCILRYRIFIEEENIIQIKNANFESIFKNSVAPIDSDSDSYSDKEEKEEKEYKEDKEEQNINNIRVEELTNDNKV